MPELRVTVTEKMDKMLDNLVATGLFTSKADLVRFATVAYLKELGWIERPNKQ
jgi:Arc/MetJ-type ribon-helix-helix transcriptional regulator